MAQLVVPPEQSVTPDNLNFKDHLKELKDQEQKGFPLLSPHQNTIFNSINAKSIDSKMT